MQTVFWLLFLLLLAGCNMWQGSPSTTAPVPITPTPTLVAAQPTAETGWTRYTDNIYRYVVSYPSTLEVDDSPPNSTIFSVKGQGGPAFPTFYISVIPKGFTNPDATAYNFIPDSTIAKMAAAKIGDTITVDNMPPDFNTFQRRSDVSVAGHQGIVVDTPNVWEGTPYLMDRRVFVTVGDVNYEFGTYYKTPTDLDQFNKFVASFQLP